MSSTESDLDKIIERRDFNFLSTNDLRAHTEKFGVVYESQLLTLKRNALLLGKGPVEITLDTDKRTILFKYKSRPSPKLSKKLEDIVNTVLGTGWCATIEPHVNTSSKSRKSSQRKRVNRSKGRSRR